MQLVIHRCTLQCTCLGILYIISMLKKHSEEQSERLIIKIPKSLAAYFRQTFPHGKRSDFVARCILNYKKKREIEEMEEQLRVVGKKRQ